MSNTQRNTVSEFFQTLSDEVLKKVRVSIPATILTFDSDSVRAEVQIGLQRKRVDGEDITPSPVIEVPVTFPGTSFVLEHKIEAGDEGILFFSHRNIDSWLDSGDVQPLSNTRKFDVNDCYFVPGLKSTPNKISNFQNDGMRIRNKDGTRYMWLKDDGSGDFNVTTLTINGALHVTQNVTTDADVVAQNVSLVGHPHPFTNADGVQSVTQAPTPTP